MAREKLTTRILGIEEVDWRLIQIIQPKKFKEQSDTEKTKLKTSFLKNGIVGSPYVWRDPDGILWCLDGKHRLDALYELDKEGVSVPSTIPATFIDCKNKKDAARLVLLYCSEYAHVSNSSFIDFIKEFDLNLESLTSEISINSVDLSTVDFLLSPSEEELVRNKKDKPHTIRITFTSIKQLEEAQKDIDNLLSKYEGAIYSVSSGEV